MMKRLLIFVGCMFFLTEVASADITVKYVVPQESYRSTMVVTLRGLPYRYRATPQASEYEYTKGRIQLHYRQAGVAKVMIAPIYSIAGKYHKAEFPVPVAVAGAKRFQIEAFSLTMEYAGSDAGSVGKQQHHLDYLLNAPLPSVTDAGTICPGQIEISTAFNIN